MDVYVDGVQSTNVNLESNPQTDVTIIGDPQASVDVAEEEKIGIEVEQEEPVDVKIDGQIYEVGNPIPGQDGFSPIVEVEEIEGGHRVTITDVEGTKVFDVLNGQNGEDGYTPVKGVDYFTDSDKREIAQEISSTYDIDGNGQVDKADDSDKLGGQLPSYYATEEQLKSKADLVDGKVPKEQLPDDIGSGLTEVAWEDIKNKPFGEEKAFEDIVWDGNTEGHLVVSQQVDLDGTPLDISYVKVSDTFMNKESVYGAEYSTYSFGEDINITVDDIWIYGETETGSYFIEVGIANVAVANDVLTMPDLGVEFTFPEVGTWVLLGLVEGEVVVNFKYLKFPPTIKYLDEKFIPDTIARQSDINKLVSALSSAIGSGVLE